LIFLKTPKTEVVGHLSLSERHRKINGQSTAQDPDHMDGCAGSTLFLLPTMCAGSWSRHISQHVAYRGEAEEATGL